jgi:serine/threonine-protein kinase
VLTGKLPFEAKNPMEYIQLHVQAKPKPINERVPGRTFPPLLWTVLSKALEKKAEDRFASAAEFAHALQAVLEGRNEVPPYGNGAQQQAMQPATAKPSSGHPPAQAQSPGQAAPTVPMPVRSSPLPQLHGAGSKPSIGLLIGVAVAFLMVGALLAALIMKVVLSK